jgi:hypothetical protein
MAVGCHEMREGQILTCEACGFELKVVRECRECAETSSECGWEDEAPCTFSCRGRELKLK